MMFNNASLLLGKVAKEQKLRWKSKEGGSCKMCVEKGDCRERGQTETGLVTGSRETQQQALAAPEIAF